MAEERKEPKQEKYPENMLQSAPANHRTQPPAAAQEQGRNDLVDSATGSAKMVDLVELKESEKRFRTIFEAAPIAIAMADPAGYFLQVNGSFQSILGYNQDEIRQLTFADIAHPDDRSKTSQLSREVRDGKINQYRIEKHYVRKDGQSVRMIVQATAVRDRNNDIKYWLALMEDITERQNAEKAIRESEEKYHNILNGIEEGYFEVDRRGNPTFFNEAMSKMLGYSTDELMAKNFREYTKPKTAQKLTRIFSKIYETGRPARVLNYEVITKDGTKKILYLSASLMRDADRAPIGFRGIVQDVTDQLIAEKQREQLANQMLHAQKMEAIGTLAGGIAHDFNNLLMGFQGNLSLMLIDVDPKHPHYEYLMNMEDYVKRGSELARQILGFARGGKYEVKATDLNALLEKSSEMFSRTKKEIPIQKKFQKNLWPVEVDRGQIEQVLLNMFVNAWQAMPSGGKLFLETENLVLGADNLQKHYALDPGKYVRISIADTGVGMDKRTRERIFEPFFTTKEVGQGTGLGLATAYGIIKNHNGIIDVESKIDQGTTFRIYLPISHK